MNGFYKCGQRFLWKQKGRQLQGVGGGIAVNLAGFRMQNEHQDSLPKKSLGFFSRKSRFCE